MPGFLDWLDRQPREAWLDDQQRGALSASAGGAHDGLAAALGEPGWLEQDGLAATLEAPLCRAAARYLVERERGSLPLDPVARFHLGNGASAHRINWPADLAPGAIRRGHGVMINYLYELDAIEARHEAFAADGTIARGPEVRRALQDDPAPAA
jgi:malonyl-CoA decarboxylase